MHFSFLAILHWPGLLQYKTHSHYADSTSASDIFKMAVARHFPSRLRNRERRKSTAFGHAVCMPKTNQSTDVIKMK